LRRSEEVVETAPCGHGSWFAYDAVHGIGIHLLTPRVKSYRKELWFDVPVRRAFVNITPQVEACLAESGVQEGLALVNAMHITASVFINDDERGLHQDF
jgi:hypothetical protein